MVHKDRSLYNGFHKPSSSSRFTSSPLAYSSSVAGYQTSAPGNGERSLPATAPSTSAIIAQSAATSARRPRKTAESSSDGRKSSAKIRVSSRIRVPSVTSSSAIQSSTSSASTTSSTSTTSSSFVTTSSHSSAPTHTSTSSISHSSSSKSSSFRSKQTHASISSTSSAASSSRHSPTSHSVSRTTSSSSSFSSTKSKHAIHRSSQGPDTTKQHQEVSPAATSSSTHSKKSSSSTRKTKTADVETNSRSHTHTLAKSTRSQSSTSTTSKRKNDGNVNTSRNHTTSTTPAPSSSRRHTITSSSSTTSNRLAHSTDAASPDPLRNHVSKPVVSAICGTAAALIIILVIVLIFLRRHKAKKKRQKNLESATSPRLSAPPFPQPLSLAGPPVERPFVNRANKPLPVQPSIQPSPLAKEVGARWDRRPPPTPGRPDMKEIHPALRSSPPNRGPAILVKSSGKIKQTQFAPPAIPARLRPALTRESSATTLSTHSVDSHGQRRQSDPFDLEGVGL